MKTEYKELLDDIELDIPFASKAFNKKPDAINFWMGNDLSFTSIHQDPYENIYSVIKGSKTFIIYPPTNEYYLRKHKFIHSKWSRNPSNNHWSIHPISNTNNLQYIDWINYEINPSNSISNLSNTPQYPNISKCQGLKITVNAGDTLYLPSLWFHQVTQSCDNFGRCIAVNHWYDMEYNITYNLIHFMKSILYKTDKKEDKKFPENDCEDKKKN